jgi:hypothetical protein
LSSLPLCCEQPTGYGYSWLVTFIDNNGNLRNLRLTANFGSLRGVGRRTLVVEVTKGAFKFPSEQYTITGLTPTTLGRGGQRRGLRRRDAGRSDRR